MATEAEELKASEEEDKAAEEEQAAEAEEQAAEAAEEQEEEEDEQRDPGSTMIASWGYNREEELLEVTFQNGREESYGCTPEQWTEAASTSSAGKWMHENVL